MPRVPKPVCPKATRKNPQDACIPYVNYCICNRKRGSFHSKDDDVLTPVQRIVETIFEDIESIKRQHPTILNTSLLKSVYPMALPIFTDQQLATFCLKRELSNHLKQFRDIYTQETYNILMQSITNAQDRRSVADCFDKIRDATRDAVMHRKRFQSLYSIARLTLCHTICKHQDAIKDEIAVAISNEDESPKGFYDYTHVWAINDIRKLIMFCVRTMQFQDELEKQVSAVKESLPVHIPDSIASYIICPYIIPKH